MNDVESFLREKASRGVKDVRVATLLRVVDEAKASANGESSERLVQEVRSAELLGTAEAAELLGVERPRIGRWRKVGIMPEPVADLKSGPVWLRSQIEGVQEERERRRRQPSTAAA